MTSSRSAPRREHRVDEVAPAGAEQPRGAHDRVRAAGLGDAPLAGELGARRRRCSGPGASDSTYGARRRGRRRRRSRSRRARAARRRAAAARATFPAPAALTRVGAASWSDSAPSTSVQAAQLTTASACRVRHGRARPRARRSRRGRRASSATTSWPRAAAARDDVLAEHPARRRSPATACATGCRSRSCRRP